MAGDKISVHILQIIEGKYTIIVHPINTAFNLIR